MVQCLVLSCAVAALGLPGVVARGAAPEQPVTLAPGETASAWSLRLRFDEVVTDSRCPTDVECVWAGSVEVAITVTAGGASAAYRLFVGEEPGAVVHEGVTIELVGVTPERVSTRAIEPEDYRATFDLRR